MFLMFSLMLPLQCFTNDLVVMNPVESRITRERPSTGTMIQIAEDTMRHHQSHDNLNIRASTVTNNQHQIPGPIGTL